MPTVTILLPHLVTACRCRWQPTAETSAHPSASAIRSSQKRRHEQLDTGFSNELNWLRKCWNSGTTMIETAENTEDIRRDAADLYWLAFLLTERQDLSIEIAADTAVSGDYASPFFTEWMRAWQRRLVIGRALTAIHDELADSARRTQLARVHGSAAPRDWSLS